MLSILLESKNLFTTAFICFSENLKVNRGIMTNTLFLFDKDLIL